MAPLRLVARAAVLALVWAAVCVAAPAPAAAHSADPRIRTVLDAVEPALPEAVVVQVQASLAAQLVVDNPTPVLLEVLGEDGRPFLRLSAAGVEADLGHPDYRSTSDPDGGVAPADGQTRWATISRGTSWGWFDHRLHPQQVEAPADQRRPVRLDDFSVPLRYGGTPVDVRGHVQFEPLLGVFAVEADPAPGGLVVQALPGRLPGLLLSNPGRVPLTVLGRDGEPFLRLGPGGVEVNTASRTHVEDRRARGQDAGPPGPEPRFEQVDDGTSYAWLDARLRYPDELPPDDVLRAGRPAVVDRWQVPIELDGDVAALQGDVRWVPEASAAARTGAVDATGGSRSAVLAGAGLALAVLVVAVLVLRRRRAPSPAARR